MTDEDISTDMQADLDEALLALEELIFENAEEAISMYDSLPKEVQSRPEYRLTLARAHQVIEQFEAAYEIAKEVLAENIDDGMRADAHHLLGDLVEDLGRSEEANGHFVKTLELDRKSFAETSTFTENELLPRIESLAKRALSELPADLQKQFPKIEVVLFPTSTLVQEGLDPRGYSYPEPGSAQNGKWTIFAGNLDAEYGDLEEMGEFDEYVIEELKNQLQPEED